MRRNATTIQNPNGLSPNGTSKFIPKIEAMSESGNAGGTISIRVSRTNSVAIAFEIRDTGPGFPSGFAAGELPPFSSTKSEGLGVGLSLCRSIVESHGGRLDVSGDRAGAVVRFSLPVADVSKG